MTRLTNDYYNFIKHVETELVNPFSVNSEIIFSVFPALGSGHFSIQLITDAQPHLLIRQWNQDLGQSIQLGVYNLDNIIITEQRVPVAAGDLLILEKIKESTIKTGELNWIILDGVDFKLTVRGQDFNWRAHDQISTHLKQQLTEMMAMAGLQDQIARFIR